MPSTSQSRHGLLEETLLCKLPFIPCRASGLPPIVSPRPSLDVVTLSNLLKSDSLVVMLASTRIVVMFGSVSTELRHKAPPNLLHSDSLVAGPAPALVRLVQFAKVLALHLKVKSESPSLRGDFSLPLWMFYL
ncbi:hypothetical protein Acr_25g0003330 [Actinidia rufa]|uniref:Uncharacterized protein n=1 Tax=Actinidia rufa TaxID=165716 RepID=A0A7J0GZG8_9ERIC|nr:hypothetical protein Acr_25g0003330 [Actinidia rufa]